MFFCWIEAHPTFVGGLISLFLGIAAITAGIIAYRGARAQAAATVEHTKLQERLATVHTEAQEIAYVIAVGIEITDIISRIVTIRQNIDKHSALHRRHSRMLSHPIVFEGNPSGIAYFPHSCAHLVVRFYSMVNMAGISFEEDTKNLQLGEEITLSREHADFEMKKLAAIVRIGLQVTDEIAANYKFFPGYDGWKESTLKRCPIDQTKAVFETD